MKKFIALLALTSLTTAFASTKGVDVIYGDDNRVDVFESRDSALVELSRSTAGMIPVENLRSSRSGEVEISAATLQSRGICAKERFSQQISAANCSGFLVAPNILVTAGHCIRSESDCASNKWVFDYKVDHAAQGDVTVPSTSVYNCKKIIERSLDQFTKDDYAVIELDRSVTDRRPLRFRKYGKISTGTPIAVIGHPTGLPTKIADGAAVRSLDNKFFVTNLDTYGGNSGSAVFNVRTSEVEGILVRGENDYVYDSVQGCQVSNRCSDTGCRGEDVTYITNIAALKKI
ncbi:MAG: trypsin-like serine peptidase [Bacteriovoracia bacterium]